MRKSTINNTPHYIYLHSKPQHYPKAKPNPTNNYHKHQHV